jgi:Zn-dependent protease with chaperone function
MGYILDIVLAIAALALSETGVATGWRAPLAVALLCCVPHALGFAVRATFVRGRFRAGEQLMRALQFSAPLCTVAALVLFGWQSSVASWIGRDVSLLAWPQLALFLVLAPFVVYEVLAIDARSRVVAAGRERRAWRGFQLRMFFSGVVPIAAYVAIASLVGWSERLRVRIEEVALYNALFAGALIVLLALFLPALLCNTWETVPIADGPERELLDAVAARARFRSRSLRVWKTGHQMANAAIVGIGPRSRVVLFSDSLLSVLDLRELAAVFAHEIGHAVRHHIPIFVMWVSAFFFGADLLASWLFPDNVWLSGTLIVAVMAVWYFAFGFMSRRFELDADLYSIDLLGDTEALIRALESVGGRLRDVASWRHFSTSERVRFLANVALEPAVAVRLRRNLRRWTCAGALLFLVTGGFEVRALLSARTRQEVQADLRLGDYATAAHRARAAHDLEPDVVALLARTSALARDGVVAADIEREARAALRMRDDHAAEEWLALGGLRGRKDLAEVGAALEKVRTGAIANARDALSEERWNEWRPELER